MPDSDILRSVPGHMTISHKSFYCLYDVLMMCDAESLGEVPPPPPPPQGGATLGPLRLGARRALPLSLLVLP
jgi:hypothetical protein